MEGVSSPAEGELAVTGCSAAHGGHEVILLKHHGGHWGRRGHKEKGTRWPKQDVFGPFIWLDLDMTKVIRRSLSEFGQLSANMI